MSARISSGQDSKQDFATPDCLILAIENVLGKIDIDLAATKENAVCQNFISPEQDSLIIPWPKKGLAFLNPPFRDIAPWAKKCSEHSEESKLQIIFLTPASVGSNWFADFVFDNARIMFISPRLTFKGATAPYPKDCMLSIFGIEAGCELWRYK